MKYTGIWLLWIGFGSGATLSSLGFGWVVSQTAMLAFFAVYGYYNLNFTSVLRSIFFNALEIFFKDADVAGFNRVPVDSPVLFACAPHNSQFVDGIVVLKALEGKRDDVHMVAAAKTMRRQYVGKASKAMNCIPVERPQDVAVVGTGKVTSNGLKLSGHSGTKFTEEIKPKDIIFITSGNFKKCNARVASVENNSELTLQSPFPDCHKIETACQFKVIPYIDHSIMMHAVVETLADRKSIAIFPEGGSHDRTELLPLKPGVAIMALQTMSKYKHLQVPIIPVGLNYYKGHQFRSRVFVDIGAPIYPSEEMVENFLKGGQDKRSAAEELLGKVEAGVKACTIQCDSYQTLQFCRFMRRVYPSRSEKPDSIERFKIMKAFSEGYKRNKDSTRVQRVKDLFIDYTNKLKRSEISDYRVSCADLHEAPLSQVVNQSTNVALLMYRVSLLVVFGIIAFPGTFLFMPVGLIASAIAQKKAVVATKGSSVKIAGRDVIATWKLMVSFVVIPLFFLFYTFLFYLYGGSVYSTVFFFFSPFIFLSTVYFYERSARLFQSVKSLLLALQDAESGKELVRQRDELQKEIRKLVGDLGWDASIHDDTTTRHLFRRFSKNLTLEDEWELDDHFFQHPRDRSNSL